MRIRPDRFLRGVLSLCALATVACSHVDAETPRSFVSGVVADTKQERSDIASELLAGGNKAVREAGPLELKARNGLKPRAIDFGWISSTGTIVAHSKSHGAIVILEPVISNGAVKWACIAYPESAKPNVC
jgi:hypothetical protein